MDYDAELHLHNEVLRQACAIRADECVLDIGCGAGQTTRDAARAAAHGSALGIDTSAAMIARARELAGSEGLRNLQFEQGDAQTWRFPSQHFDAAISRFGTMFFADPVAAFRNIRSSLKAGGRLVMMVWQGHAANEWSDAIQQCLTPGKGSPAVSLDTLDPFSLADRDAVERILAAAGFAETKFREVREPVYYGADVAAALEWIKGFQCTQEVLRQLDATGADSTLERLRDMLAKHERAQGVWFDARAWIVTALRP
jgi:SAM-dependent methyltransferase